MIAIKTADGGGQGGPVVVELVDEPVLIHREGVDGVVEGVGQVGYGCSPCCEFAADVPGCACAAGGVDQ